MKKIVIFCEHYLPGYKGGGPIRTVYNLTEQLGKEYSFTIVADDRDLGDEEAYPNIVYDAPNKVGNAEVWYIPPKGFTFSLIKKLTKNADVVYCCGPYRDYAYKTMLLKRFGKLKRPLVIASMGSFSEGAFKIKSAKKQAFVFAGKLLGLFKKIVWSVTSPTEAETVKKHIGKRAQCYVAEDLPRKLTDINITTHGKPLRVIFLARICKIKNLRFAIEVLREVQQEVIFDIYGTKEDMEYWQECKKALVDLPSNIRWEYKGVVQSEKVVEVFSEYDVFLFPTLGENYGHVIFEALAGGCIPIISNQTPWQDFAKKECGKVLPLQKQLFVKEIRDFVDMEEKELLSWRQNGRIYAEWKQQESLAKTGYKKVFDL